jgi:hydroxymethylpyrimidine pyrophosphatase-like HAD family hydrolase
MIYCDQENIDIVPASAGKGNAVRYVMVKREFRDDEDIAIVAGDSGNDIEMFNCYKRARGIIPYNAASRLIDAPKISPVYYSPMCYAGGVIDGLKHFGVW